MRKNKNRGYQKLRQVTKKAISKAEYISLQTRKRIAKMSSKPETKKRARRMDSEGKRCKYTASNNPTLQDSNTPVLREHIQKGLFL